MKTLDKDVAVHNLKEELKFATSRKEKNVILSLIELLEQDKIEAIQSQFGLETYYRYKPSPRLEGYSAKS